jgi:hypothetical protein
VVGIEKLWVHGERFSKAVGVASLGLAGLVIFVPELAPGLTGETMGAMDMAMGSASGTR